MSMQHRTLSISYKRWESISELPESDQQLLQLAQEITHKAYAPYSQFYVGAVIRLQNGQIITGTNQENAAYPLCLCAERTALSTASSIAQHLVIDTIAITARNPQRPVNQPVSPCGACRQTMKEYESIGKQPMRILLSGEEGAVLEFEGVDALLPFGFDATWL